MEKMVYLSYTLRAQSVAEFYSEYRRSLAALGVAVQIEPALRTEGTDPF
ncbi:MAG: hypothetical protein JSR71_00660 [Proteobacteria bacterium]|nr:hypothetical protein [Pseudomonadota bacterium]